MIVLDIIQGTPVWVWLLLAFLIYRGLRCTHARRSGLYAPLILPLVMLVVSLSGGRVATGEPADLAWMAAFAAGILAGAAAASRMAIEVEPGPPASLLLPGSWASLILILAIFSLNYALGVMHAMAPDLAASPLVATVAALLRGGFGGVFFGRGLAIVWRARALADVARADGAR
ncbi:DUF6622 family protein [Breoghania sp. JC706]|uniref:DUF6622 family protein n=1 Tax=Breoghania sp. JC706 TaxID=3117732 RepID=UPI00300BBF8D